MAKAIQGTFSDEMKKYFNAQIGAYTAFTEQELGKSTFNVKKVIRNMLIKKLGRENIPIVNQTKDQCIEFHICKKAKTIKNFDKTIKIDCKFSKVKKDEMTIYFTKPIIDKFAPSVGDIWYIYFMESDPMPYFGIMSQRKWESFDIIEELSKDRGYSIGDLQYEIDIETLIIDRTDPPTDKIVVHNNETTVRSTSPEEAGKREKGRKIKGNIGEEIVLEIEKRKLREIKRADLIPKVMHVAEKRDGLGYDIISVEIDADGAEKEIYIEVKSTSADINEPFYVSKREKEVSERLGMSYYIYRIYHLKENSKRICYYTIQGSIGENFHLEPISYMAYKK